MADAGTLTVKIDADSAGLSSGIAQAQSRVQGFAGRMQSVGSGMKGLGRNLSISLTAPLALMGKMGVDELKDIQAANAQTEASIKRLGAGVKISTRSIQEQAGALQRLSGMDDQAIQSGQNLLLTQGNLNVKTAAGARAFEKASRVMVDYAAATGKDPVAAAKGLAKALADPENNMKRLAKEAGMTKAQQDALAKRMEAVSSPAQKQAILLGALEQKYRGAGAAAGDTLGAKLAILQDRVAGVAAKFVEALIPAVDTMTSWASKLLGFVEQLSPSQQKWAAIIAVVAAAMGPLLIVVGSLVSAIGVLIPVIAAISLPMVAVVAAIGLLVAAFVYAWRTSETFRAIVEAAINNVALVAKTVMAALRGDWSTVWNNIKTLLETSWTAIKILVAAGVGFLKTTLSAAWGVIKTAASSAWDGVRGTIDGAWDGIRSGVGTAVDAVKTRVSNAWEAIQTWATKSWTAIKTAIVGAIDDLPSALAKALGSIPGKLGEIGSEAGAAFAKGLKGAVNAVISAFNSLSTPSFDIGIPGTDKSISVGSVSLPDMPLLARGGITKGPSIAGEAGPEAVIPLGGSMQNRLDRQRVLGEIGIGGSGITQHFHITNPVEDLAGFMQRARFQARVAGG